MIPRGADRRSPAFRLFVRLWDHVTGPSPYALAGWLFRRLLGLVYLLAFWSLSRQVLGLIGADGILPARDYMETARAWASAGAIGISGVHLLPTLLWIDSSDATLQLLCYGGAALAALLVAGIAPAVLVPLLWLAYLSLSVVGRDFLSYQWDTLLLEAGFLAIFIAPASLRDRLRDASSPPRLAVWLFWWLTFRLMFGSGAVKLASGDPTWANLTALTVHYETQPIPTPVAWYAHQLPPAFHTLSAAAVLGIELVAPVLIFGPRRGRIAASALVGGLQAIIALTGNYAFFNVLSASLTVLLLDDRMLSRVLRRELLTAATGAWRRAAVIAAAALLVPASAAAFLYGLGAEPPRLADAASALVAPLRIANTYGLFAVMTTTRPEIEVEGSEDGIDWRTYEFKYKPGDPTRRPPWVAPHQPRLDWQLWFAALDTFDREPWFQRFGLRLLDGSPAVLALLEGDPFAGRRPRYLRATLYRYRFSDWSARRAEGVWWTRERLGDYSPVLGR